MLIPTVRIKGIKGGMLINEKDFDSDKHELFIAPKKEVKLPDPPKEKEVEEEKATEPKPKRGAKRSISRRRK